MRGRAGVSLPLCAARSVLHVPFGSATPAQGQEAAPGGRPENPPVSSCLPLLGCLCSVEGVRRRAGDFQKVSLHCCRGIQWLGWFSPIPSASPLLAFSRGVLYCFSFAEKKQELSKRRLCSLRCFSGAASLCSSSREPFVTQVPRPRSRNAPAALRSGRAARPRPPLFLTLPRQLEQVSQR